MPDLGSDGVCDPHPDSICPPRKPAFEAVPPNVRALLRQQLRDAIRCVRGLPRSFPKKYDYAEARAWFLSDDPEYSATSFVVCCELLGLNPEQVRKHVLSDTPITVPGDERVMRMERVQAA